MQNQDVLSRVVHCIAATTRYPSQVLTVEADLANDLGIDSVKRVEIIAALEREFQLDLSGHQRDNAIATIGQIAEWLERLILGHQGKQSSVNEQTQNGHAPQNGHPVRHGDQSKVVLTTANGITNSPIASQISGIASSPEGSTNRRFSSAHVVPPPPAGLAPLVKQPEAASEFAERPPASLEGKVALVTGSSRSVGRTIARVLAMKGATVIVNSFHSRDLGDQVAADLQAQGAKAIHIWGSVANPVQVDSMFDEIESTFGRLDILVCNASDGRIGPFTEVAQEDWDRAFRTNVTGHYQCAMRASRLMQRGGGGAIVTMSSIAAQRYVEGLGGQGVIKAAVESLTRYLACELAPLGIRTNCVSGGPVYGDVMARYQASRPTLNYWETLVTDSELCSPLDLANTVAFLVSDEARGVNGAIWSVDHGLATRSHSRPLPRPSLEPHRTTTV